MSIASGRNGMRRDATKSAVFAASVVLFATLGARAEATVVGSEPPDGAIDARVPHPPGDGSVAFGWDSIVVTLQGLTSELVPDDFTVTEEGGDGIAPTIIALTPVSSDSVELSLSEPIEPGAWTIVTHNASQTGVRLGFLPGDVNGDGVTAPSDLLYLIDSLNGVRDVAQWSADIGRSGAPDEADVFALSQLLRGEGGYAPWLHRSLPNAGPPEPGQPNNTGEMAVVELVPRTTGPYDPGETVTVDISIRRDPPGDDILIRLMTFDFADSEPLFTLITPVTHANGTMFWDYSSTPVCQNNPAACGVLYIEFLNDPEFSTVFVGFSADPDLQIIIPGDGSAVQLAILEVELPHMSGSYTLDAMNYDATSLNDGARLDFDFPATTWHVSTGHFSGGVIVLEVGLGDPGACCTPPEAPQGEGCVDLIHEECEAILDGAGNPAVWQGGVLCGEPGQDCVRWTCQYATGDCTKINSTPGCEDPNCCDDVCNQDPFCCDIEWDAACVSRALLEESCQFDPTGSCCDDITGDCVDGVILADCMETWTEGVACIELDPPCEQAVAPCCVFDGSCVITGVETCLDFGGTVLDENILCEGDADGDGIDQECGDECPNDPDKLEPGVCGCGVADTDSDGDGTLDCLDGCPDDPLKTEPGVCGCGVADVDSDGDGVLDCNDGCPNDPLKLEPGACGCGVADTDTDGDGAADCIDSCPADPLKIEPGDCGCGVPDVDENDNGITDCLEPDEAIPTVSTWGLLLLGLLLLVAAKTHQVRKDPRSDESA